MIRATEHLKGFSAVDAEFNAAVVAMRPWLRRFGSVSEQSFTQMSTAFDFLFPFKSFTTRYLLIECLPWTLLVEDMREQNCKTDAFAISRETHCRGISVTVRDDDRSLNIFEDGKWVRWIESSKDGNQWHFLESGALQPFEDIHEVHKKRKKDRLSAEAAKRYFEQYTGMSMPKWSEVRPSRIVGMERSVQGVANEIVRFDCQIDL